MDPALELIEAMRLLVYQGMTNPRGGNGSIRLIGNKILITPSGLPKHVLKPEDLVIYDLETGRVSGRYKPSIELPAHELIYRVRSDVHAILHAHPTYTLALTDLGLENWWETGLVETEYSVGRVRVVEPAPPGSMELARNIAEGFKDDARIVIIPKHGVFAAGENIYVALDAITALEESARYVFVKNVMGRIIGG